jgi:hypothetical protein
MRRISFFFRIQFRVFFVLENFMCRRRETQGMAVQHCVRVIRLHTRQTLAVHLSLSDADVCQYVIDRKEGFLPENCSALSAKGG